MYVVASWVIVQVVSTVEAPLNLPDWFDTVVIVLLGIGFPLAVLFAWAFELTPEGIRVTQPASGNAPAASSVDYFLIGALLIVAGTVAWNQFDRQPRINREAVDIATIDKSIAVLPFADMSPQGDQEYFGDGIAEELLNELTNLEGLRVAGRTSSFSFKGRNEDIRAIGAALNVSLILEGSVRKDGDRIRITAQLISAKDGYHYWSQTYNRDLTDIFAIQDEIAAAVAGTLGVRLGVGDVNSFPGAGTDSVEAYEAYLQATRFPIISYERIRELERVVKMDPDYAAALADLGLSIASTMWINQPEEAPGILDRAIPILLRAIELRPDSAFAYTLLATVNYARFDWIQSEEYFEQSHAIAQSGFGLGNHGNLMMRAGRSEAAVSTYDRAATAERFPDEGPSELAMNAFLALERYDEVANIIAALPEGDRKGLNYLVALNKGDPTEIRTAIGAFRQNVVAISELAAPLLPLIESPAEALSHIRSVYANTNVTWPSKYHDVALLAAYFGDPEFALEVFSVEARLTTIRLGALWYPGMSEARRLPEFKTLVSDINLVDYWRTYGWSSHCRPLGEDDFECF